MTSFYFRSPVLSFSELPESWQKEYNELQDSSFFHCPERDLVLPLDGFIRINSPVWDGAYGQTYFSAYYCKISRCGSEALVAYRYC